MAALIADLRSIWRFMRARPAFAALIVLTLGVGIGANSAIFSIVHALLFQPFPFKDPDRLVRVATIKGGEEGPLSIPELDDLESLSDVVHAVAGYTDQGLYNASGFGAPEELQATITTHNLFEVLGVRLHLGSTWPASYNRSRQFALVIGHSLWARRFGEDPNIVGRTMTLDGSPGYVIHGVLPPALTFPSHSDLFRSSGIAADPKSYERRDLRQRYALVRLKPGVSVAQARGRIEELARCLEQRFPATNSGVGFTVAPLRDLYVGEVRPYLVLMFAGVMLLLLIACANVINLLCLVPSRETASSPSALRSAPSVVTLSTSSSPRVWSSRSLAEGWGSRWPWWASISSRRSCGCRCLRGWSRDQAVRCWRFSSACRW